MIRTADVLTKEECLDLRSSVHRLRPRWIQRYRWVPFYTLGAASYLDAAQRGTATYYGLAAEYNPLLRDSFPWLYDRLAAVLRSELRAPVTYAEKLALPGFHVFLDAKLFEYAVARIHRDLQYKLLHWSGEEGDGPDATLSFTLAVALPESGGGLNVWETESKMTHIAYCAGSLVLHFGDVLHQIAPTPRVQPGDERITIQGHGVLRRGAWQLYW